MAKALSIEELKDLAGKKDTIIIDASEHIAGRLCSYTAKLLLKGKRVIILNCEKAVISGNKASILQEQYDYLKIASVINPKHTPRHPRRPDNIIKRMIRGMVPRREPKGINAMKRLRVYIGVPEEYTNTRAIKIEDAKITRPVAYYTSIYEIAKLIGWRG